MADQVATESENMPELSRRDFVKGAAATGFAVALATPLSHPERYRHFLVLRVDTSSQPSLEELTGVPADE